MQFQFPFNDTYLFIGFPVLLGLAYNTYNKYKSTKNKSSLYISIAAVFLAVSVFMTGVPTLFSKDPEALRYYTFIADLSQALFLYTIWLLVINIFLTKSKIARFVGYLLATGLLVASAIEIGFRNLNPPYGIQLVELSDKSYDIIINQSNVYLVLVSLGYLSLVIAGFAFWKNSAKSGSASQRLRVQSLAIAFIIGSILFVVLPDYPVSPYLDIKDIAVSSTYVIIGLSMLITKYQSNKKRI